MKKALLFSALFLFALATQANETMTIEAVEASTASMEADVSAQMEKAKSSTEDESNSTKEETKEAN